MEDVEEIRGGSIECCAIPAEIAPVYKNSDSIVTIVSDDGDFETGKYLDYLASKYDLKVTVAGVVDIIQPHLDTWKNIENKGHVELISHSWSHKKMTEGEEFTEEELQHEITDSIQFYKENFKTDQISFIPPENTMNQRGYEILKDNNIYSIRQGIRGENSLTPLKGVYPAQWYRLYTSGIGDLDTTDKRNSVVDSAIENNTWLIEMWHNIYEGNQPNGYQAISLKMAEEHMEYLEKCQEEGEIWVASFVDATKYLYEKEYATVSARYQNNRIVINLELDNNELPAEVFDHALTVKVYIPEKWREEDSIVTEKNKMSVTIQKENGVPYAIIDMLPNSEQVLVID